MEHKFNVAVACDVGVLAAAMLDRMSAWVEHDMDRDADGRCWTRNGDGAWAAQFPYANGEQIDAALHALESKGYVLCDGDRYALTDVAEDLLDGREPRQRARRPRRRPTSEARFVPPTIDQVREYAESRGSDIDPQTFLDYYECSGWKDSKGNPVRNWKQRMITWERHAPGKKDGGRAIRNASYDRV